MPREMALLIYLGAALLSMSAGENGTCGAAEQHRMHPCSWYLLCGNKQLLPVQAIGQILIQILI